jgi:hypothetical protein
MRGSTAVSRTLAGTCHDGPLEEGAGGYDTEIIVLDQGAQAIYRSLDKMSEILNGDGAVDICDQGFKHGFHEVMVTRLCGNDCWFGWIISAVESYLNHIGARGEIGWRARWCMWLMMEKVWADSQEWKIGETELGSLGSDSRIRRRCHFDSDIRG